MLAVAGYINRLLSILLLLLKHEWRGGSDARAIRADQTARRWHVSKELLSSIHINYNNFFYNTIIVIIRIFSIYRSQINFDRFVV